MFDLFGSEMPMALKFFIAFMVVLALIGLTAWLVRRFGAGRLGGANARGRQPRLAVIDAATVDGRRRLVLIRRDNVEHLLMIGGPTDVVVEPNIVRAAAARDVPREPPRNAERGSERGAERGAERAAEPAPRPESSWPLQPATEPAPVAAARPYRVAPTEEPWLAPEPGARPRPAETSLTGLAAELSTRLNPPDAAPPVRNEPPRASAPSVVAVEPAAPPQTDHNLAEMALQLEAALRRTPMPEGRAPVTDPLAARAPARDVKARVEPKFDAPKFEPKPETTFEPEPKPEPKFEDKFEAKFDAKPEPRPEPKFEPRFEPKFDAKSEAKPEAKPEPKFEPKPAPAAAPGKTVYDNLEEEMASLLGRPSGKT